MSRQREQKLAAIYDAFDAKNYKVSLVMVSYWSALCTSACQC